MSNNNQQIEAFKKQQNQMVAMLKTMLEEVEDNFDLYPDCINWTDVEQIKHYNTKIADVHNQIFNLGEYS